MNDNIKELGAEFRSLRAEQARLKRRTATVTARLKELRPKLAAAIVEDLTAGGSVQDITNATGYDRDSIRKIRLAASVAKPVNEVAQ